MLHGCKIPPLVVREPPTRIHLGQKLCPNRAIVAKYFGTLKVFAVIYAAASSGEHINYSF